LLSRIHHFVDLDESRRKAFDDLLENQGKVKMVFDKKARLRQFKPGDTVLMWDKERDKLSKNGKFDCLWRGPF
jgi:hypothetical protein